MTETLVTFMARASDILEQRTRTVGYIADHCEVSESLKIIAFICIAHGRPDNSVGKMMTRSAKW